MKKIWMVSAVLLFCAPTFAKIDLNGTWETKCIPFGQNQRHGFISTVTIDELNFSIQLKMYADGQCGHHNLTVNYAGTYSMDVTSGPYTNLNHTPQKVEMTIYDQAVVDVYNTPSSPEGCGITEWQIGHAQNVAGRFCRPFQMPTIGKMIYDICANEDGMIQFGVLPMKWDITDPLYRPTVLSNIKFYKRP